MTLLTVQGSSRSNPVVLHGVTVVPGDKSISHRALMLGALADGTGRIDGFLPSGDCLATLACMRRLGVEIDHADIDRPTSLVVHGRGLRGLKAPAVPLDCRRSGTTMRLLAGILAGQTFDSVLTGEPQLLRRPMRRITQPLSAMGARIEDTDGHAPLVIHGQGSLRRSDHVLKVASAQVKSAILLGGLYADGPVTVQLPGPARDHTERMVVAQIERSSDGPAPLTYDMRTATVDSTGIRRLRAIDRVVPGDISSAAFLIVAALLLPGSDVAISGVGVNATRTGFLDVLHEMGADLVLEHRHEQGGEPIADIRVKASALYSTEIQGDTVVRMIDEFPILAVLATQATGRTVVRDAAELRVKETDRIATVATELTKMGARIEPQPDGFVVEGPTPLVGGEVNSYGDHRLGMALTIAGLIATGKTSVLGSECIPDSFPGFAEALNALGAQLSHEV